MQRNYRNQYNYYTDGNTVRKVNREPERIDRVQEKNLAEYKTSYKEEEGVKLNISYALFLAVAAVAVIMSCIKYINLNSEVSALSNSIATLETTLDTVKAQNDAMEYEIDGFVDIDYIIKSAKKDLGMVAVDEDKIRFYTSTDGEYMKQFLDVPEN